MKRLMKTILWLTLATSAFAAPMFQGQQPCYELEVTGTTGNTGWLRRVQTNNSGTWEVSQTTAYAANGFVLAARKNNYLSKLLRVNLYAGTSGTNMNAALTPLIIGSAGGGIDPEINHNFVVATDYVETGSTGGLKGDGATKYLQAGWNPTTASLSLSSSGIWHYTKTAETSGSTRVIIGVLDTSQSFLSGLLTAGTIQGGRLASAVPAPASNSTNDAMQGVTTNGAGTGGRDQQYYRNGLAVGSAVNAITDTFPNREMFIMAGNSSGTASFFTSAPYMRGYFITSGMSATDAANLSTDVTAFETALNRN